MEKEVCYCNRKQISKLDRIMKIKQLSLFALIALFAISCSAPKKEAAKEEPVAEVKEVKEEEKGIFFKSPKDGATVSSPVFIEMGIKGMKVQAAGEVIEGTGHHHILINQTGWPQGEIIPKSDTTLHFGKGQKDASVELEPGEYTLSLQFANGVHQSFGEEWATSINITVE